MRKKYRRLLRELMKPEFYSILWASISFIVFILNLLSGVWFESGAGAILGFFALSTSLVCSWATILSWEYEYVDETYYPSTK